jgi:hypothetical protein
LTVDKPGGVGLTQNVTVNDALDLLSGTLHVGERTLTLKGAASGAGGALASLPAGTVYYASGAAGQAVLPAPYGNLVFDDFSKTLPDTGVVQVSNTFTPGSAAHTLGSSTFEFNGQAPQALPAGFPVYYNLEINNPAGVAGLPDLEVLDQLRVKTGSFHTAGSLRDLEIREPGMLSAAGDLAVYGSWTQDGGFAHNNFTVTFGSEGIQDLDARAPLSFYALTVGPGVTLNEVHPADNISVVSTLANHGMIRKQISGPGSGPRTFGLTGAAVDLTTPGSLTALVVERIDSSHPEATGASEGQSLKTGIYWTIRETAAAPGWALTLKLPRRGLPEPKVCKYPGSQGGFGWDCAASGADADWVWRDGITTFKDAAANPVDWSVGSRVGPTAVALRSLSARSEGLTPIFWIAGLLGLAVLAAGAGLRLALRAAPARKPRQQK